MSVSVHEAFSLDSAQDRYWWMDHFLGDQVKDEWRLAVVGGGTGVVVDQQTGGIVRLSAPTNATADEAGIDWNDIRSLLVSKKVSMEARVKISSIINTRFFLSLRFDANNRIYFRYNTGAGDATWRIVTTDGGAITNNDSGITPDTDYHIYRIECFPTGEVHFYVDGVECGNSPITTNIPDDATDYFQPRFNCRTAEVALKQLDIDYVAIRQDR